MIQNHDFSIERFDFDYQTIENLTGEFVANLWPVVYLLSDDMLKEVYVGETTDTSMRLRTHLKNGKKKKLSIFHLISGGQFNKSVTLDIESSLIKYISADGQYQLLNGNLGIANHSYYQQKDYWNVFKGVWDGLRAEGVCKHSIEHLDNSDLFKYSPYKALSYEQTIGLNIILDNLISNSINNTIVEGGAGTGKTILAIFLFKLLNTNHSDFNFREFGDNELEIRRKVKLLKEKYVNPKMALVIPMSSLRNTLKRVFKNIKGLKASMVIGPAQVAKTDYDIIVVDESHRLRKRVNLGAYFGAFDKINIALEFDKLKGNELDWVLKKSNKAILFYDNNQSIKPSDVSQKDFDNLKSKSTTKVENLSSQLRVIGGNYYVDFVHQLLECKLNTVKDAFVSKTYDFQLFDSISKFDEAIKSKDQQHGLSRMIAGYSWKWISKKSPELFDIEIEGHKLKWNSTNIDWVNSENAIHEVGCIHTTQGYDLNYAGVIFGNEIDYNKERNEIVINEKNYFDINGKQSIVNPKVLKDYIINIYATILLRGIKGVYIYACNKDLQTYLSHYIPLHESYAADRELAKVQIHEHKCENFIPYYNFSAAAGNFSGSIIVDKPTEWIKLPKGILFNNDFFACKVSGESMNRIIPNNSICLFRKYNGGSRSGKIVLAQSTEIQDADFGSGYTVKEYQSSKVSSESGWEHQSIILNPISHDVKYQPISLDESSNNDFKVIGFFEQVLS